MKLINCEHCGVVLNQDIFTFEYDDLYEEDGSIKEGVAIWVNDRFVAAIDCPVCKNQIETDIKI